MITEQQLHAAIQARSQATVPFQVITAPDIEGRKVFNVKLSGVKGPSGWVNTLCVPGDGSITPRRAADALPQWSINMLRGIRLPNAPD